MYIFLTKKTKKTINDYAELLTEIRNEYAKLQQESNQLKIQLQKYKNTLNKYPKGLTKNQVTKNR